MKYILSKYSITNSVLVVIFLLLNNISVAQEIELSNYKMRFNFNTVKNDDNTRLLEVKFISYNKKNRKDIIPIYNAEIKFFNVLNGDELLLGSGKTSKEGVAQFIVPENQVYLTDDDGSILLSALFEGSPAIHEESKEILVKDLHLTLDLKEIDSIKTVQVSAYTLNKLGEKILIDDVEIGFYVQGMLSKMVIEEGIINNGNYKFDFVTDLPGDPNRNLLIEAMIIDSEEYWNVNQKELVKWGAYHNHPLIEEKTLWSAVAPLWMYTVLTIMLVGVWANYLYTIINLFKIKKEGDDLNLNIFSKKIF